MTSIDQARPKDPPTRIVSHEVDARGLTIRLEHGLLSLTPRSSRTVRIRYTLADELSTKPSLTVVGSARRRAASALPRAGPRYRARAQH